MLRLCCLFTVAIVVGMKISTKIDINIVGGSVVLRLDKTSIPLPTLSQTSAGLPFSWPLERKPGRFIGHMEAHLKAFFDDVG